MADLKSIPSPASSAIDHDVKAPEEKKTKRPGTTDTQQTLTEGDPFLVVWKEGDPANPQNWSRIKRWYITMASGLLILNATFASSAPSGIIPQLMEEFHFSSLVATLTLALFVAGYCVGPLAWGPLSEQYGRRPLFLITFFVYMLFQVGTALANNTATILTLRLLGGIFAACPLTNAGAVIADMWDAKTRGKALAIYTIAPFAGPALGPSVAGFMAVSGVKWRWIFWLLTMFSGFCILVIFFTIPETYSPILLRNKAIQLRKETGDDRFYAAMEANKTSFSKTIERVLARPFVMLAYEPMLMASTAYLSFVYGVIYLLFEAYPIVFTQGHHLNAGVSGLMFFPIPVGGAIAIVIYVFVFNPRYERAVAKAAPSPVGSEIRLEPCLWGAPMLVISLFWFGWTSYPSIPFVVPMLSGLLMGAATCWIFLGIFNYMLDTYLVMAASALAANTVVRSLFGAVFPLFSTQMYEKLNPRWASTLIALIALVMVPIPFVFTKWGPTLRAKSRFAPTRAIPKTSSQDIEKA